METVTRYMDKGKAKTLIQLNECPNCGAETTAEWVPAIPEGALKKWKCKGKCGKEFSLPQSIVCKYQN